MPMGCYDIIYGVLDEDIQSLELLVLLKISCDTPKLDSSDSRYTYVGSHACSMHASTGHVNPVCWPAAPSCTETHGMNQKGAPPPIIRPVVLTHLAQVGTY